MVIEVPTGRHLQMTFVVLIILLTFVLIQILTSSPYYFRIKSFPVYNQSRYQNISSMRSGEQGNKNTLQLIQEFLEAKMTLETPVCNMYILYTINSTEVIGVILT